MMIAQAELRTTRTRRQAKRPDYVYNADDFEDDYEENNGDLSDEEFNGGSSRTTPDEEMVDYIPEDDTEGAPRRSTRNAGKRARTTESAKPVGRRSARLAENAADNRSTTSCDDDLDISAGKVVKRARTATASPLAVDRLSLEHERDNKIKPTEVAVESVAGRKRSKVRCDYLTNTNASHRFLSNSFGSMRWSRPTVEQDRPLLSQSQQKASKTGHRWEVTWIRTTRLHTPMAPWVFN
ncbi:hypothetical protein FRC08_008513 [Ceratobasidium sp. 394]|nr:hypothetical protein FRC08_008513 [Ceratobasidium sp. 394]